MPTKHDIFEPGYAYHIYNRAIGSELLFHQKRNYYFFLKLLNQKLSNHIDIHAFCLMNNHFHLLVYIKESIEYQEVSLAFRRFGISYAQSINKQEGRKGSLFMRPIKRKRITSEEYYKQVLIYIHRNPLTHGLVKNLNDFNKSSYKIFISEEFDKKMIINLIDIFSIKRTKEILKEHFEDIGNFIACHKKPSDPQFLDKFEIGE